MKSRNGLAFCLSVVLASVAHAGAVIELVPDVPGPYDGGEALTVEVFLRQAPADVDHLLRLVQLDLTLTDPAIGIGVADTHPGITFWDFGTTQHCIDNPTDCGADLYIDGSRIDLAPPGVNILVVAFGSANELGPSAAKQLTLPGDAGVAVKIGELNVRVPDNAGKYLLDVVNADETDPDLGAQLRWGFGQNINGESLTTWRAATSDLGGGTLELCVDLPQCDPLPVLIASEPDCDKSLWRSENNFVLLTFDNPIPEPAPGEVMIQEITDAGGTGADISANFTFTVEGAMGEVLRITENGDSPLTHRTWYRFTNLGGWTGAANFERDYVVQVGDVDNNGLVLGIDFSIVNGGIPCVNCPDDRRDINGDNRILGIDASIVNGSIASPPVAKPSGHDCSP